MAITLKNPASDLAALLTGQTLNGEALTTGTNLFAKQVHPAVWSTTVVLLNTGGDPPTPYASATRGALFEPTVQCLVYSPPGEDGFDLGEGLAREVLGYVQQIGTGLSGYVTALAREAQPVYLGPDVDTQRHSWSMNFRVIYTA